MPGKDMSDQFILSIAVPIYNEEDTLAEMVRRTLAVLDHIPGGPHQLLFVDDGSSDGTMHVLEQAARSDSRISVISLSRNFGHQAALSAALDWVVGDAIVLMDGDLQDAPEAIPILLDRLSEGYDVVYATRASRQGSWLLRLCYFLFYRFQTMLSDTQLPIDTGDFSVMSRRVADRIRRMPERQRYLRGLRSWVGFRQVGVAIHRTQRYSGKSKYSLLKLLRLASDGIFAFSVVPLRAATMIGAAAVTFSVLFAFYSVYARFILNRSPRGFTALVFLITFLSGVLLFFLGVIGEYVGRVYEEVKARPVYVVERVIGMDSSSLAEHNFVKSRASFGEKR